MFKLFVQKQLHFSILVERLEIHLILDPLFENMYKVPKKVPNCFHSVEQSFLTANIESLLDYYILQ